MCKQSLGVDWHAIPDPFSSQHAELVFGVAYAQTIIGEFEAARAGNTLAAFNAKLKGLPPMNLVKLHTKHDFMQDDNSVEKFDAFFIRGIWRLSTT